MPGRVRSPILWRVGVWLQVNDGDGMGEGMHDGVVDAVFVR